MKNSSVATKALFSIDKYIDTLVKKIELLSYVNPTNIASEKEKFFALGCKENPVFKYPKLDFDKFLLHREMFTQPIELIEDDGLKQLYEDIIYFYSGLIQCIETVGDDKKFYYNSLHSFGTPTEQDVENAKFILQFDEENPSEEIFQPKYSAQQAEQLFRDYSKRYQFTYSIKYSDKMSAIAMVLNNIQTLVLNSNHKFSDSEI